jgi:hypothetical protein
MGAGKAGLQEISHAGKGEVLFFFVAAIAHNGS